MRMLLRPEYRNGHFGDPALYLWETFASGALLLDCGDLSRLSNRELLRVRHLFISHCHIDHFFGFDLFLRVHVGSERTVRIHGPPATSARVGGKLQGYTWNLIRDQNLEFLVHDLDARNRRRTITRFHARDEFRPSPPFVEEWSPEAPVLDEGTYRVLAAQLDHRTPSMAYSVEEKKTVRLDADALERLGLVAGPWIQELKSRFLAGEEDRRELEVPTREGGSRRMPQGRLSRELLIPLQRHKIAYVTDGAAHSRNREAILPLIAGADTLFAETCFLEEDSDRARETQHFTAAWMGALARDAGVRALAPIHFSKRYIECPERVLTEVASSYSGEVIRLEPGAPLPRL